MPSTPSTKPEYIGPSLKYLVIYNPTLKLPRNQSNSAEDDDDAIEQSHILFYTASHRAVARDQMLRQVGLAKALNSFSTMFSADGCDGVHSQKARMVMVEPEPDFWLLASLDVPRTARQTRPKDNPPSSSSKSESTDKPKPTRTTSLLSEEWDYKENVLFDDYLRTYMSRGYAQFKLLHGTFSSYIETNTRSALEKQLERFFTTWSWNWDVNHLAARLTSSSLTTPDLSTSTKIAGPDFPEHLGLPLHPSTSPGTDSAEIVESSQKLMDLAPAPLIPLILCLHPPSMFPARPDAPLLPESLPRYLLSVVPSPTSTTARQRQASGASTATLRHPGTSTSTRNSEDSRPIGSYPSAGFLQPLGKLHMGVTLGNVTSAVNPKKWGWPGYLTFGHSSAASSVASSRDPSPTRGREAVKEVAAAVIEDIVPAKGSVDPAVGKAAVAADVTVTQPTQPAEHSLAAVMQTLTPPSLTPRGPESTVIVDQSLLEDAISDSGSISERLASPSDNHDIGERAQDVSEDRATGTPPAFRAAEEPSAALNVETPRPPERSLKEKDTEEDAASGPEANTPVEFSQDPPPDDVIPASPTTTHTFSYMTIHLDDTPEDCSGQDTTTSRRRLLYHVRDHLVFAMVLEPDANSTATESSSEMLSELPTCEHVHENMGLLSTAIDRWTHHCEAILTGKSQPPGVTSQEHPHMANTRHVLCDVRREVTKCSVGFESTFPHFFTAKQVLSRFPTMHEIISRTDGLRWFAARRQLSAESDGGGVAAEKLVRRQEVEIYAEVGRKDASLVDVEREVDMIWQSR